LSISPRTVKKHTINIYRKLGVAGRRQAVVKAKDLGLLPAAASHGGGGWPGLTDDRREPLQMAAPMAYSRAETP
jgi:hypothetical protein